MKANLLIPVFFNSSCFFPLSTRIKNPLLTASSSECDSKVSIKSIGAKEFPDFVKEANSIILDVSNSWRSSTG